MIICKSCDLKEYVYVHIEVYWINSTRYPRPAPRPLRLVGDRCPIIVVDSPIIFNNFARRLTCACGVPIQRHRRCDVRARSLVSSLMAVNVCEAVVSRIPVGS